MQAVCDLAQRFVESVHDEDMMMSRRLARSAGCEHSQGGRTNKRLVVRTIILMLLVSC